MTEYSLIPKFFHSLIIYSVNYSIMKIRFFGIGFAFIILGCTQKVESFSCEEMEQMIESDQELRLKSNILDGYFRHFADSIAQTFGKKPEIDGTRYYTDEIIRDASVLAQKFKDSNAEKYDSMWAIQNKIDLKNTNRLIEIIENNDFEELLKKVCFEKWYLVFVHTPKEKTDKVADLINRNENLIPTKKLTHIRWHLNGRQTDKISDPLDNSNQPINLIN